MFVLDASVAVKWLVPEEGRAEARQLLLGDDPLLAPDLIAAEVATGISRKARVGQISQNAARRVLKDWLRLLESGVLTIAPSAGLLEDAMDLSLALDHPLPDCLYLALARRTSSPLITADAKLARKAGSVRGLQVRLLGAS